MKAKFWPGRARVVRTSELLLASVMFAASGLAQGQDQSQQPAADVPEEGEVIVVTGSRIARDISDASTPIAVVGSEEIKLSGSMTVDEMLNEQPQFVSATNGGSTANTVPGGSAAGAAYVNLRGFGPTRSLTLVNGRRFAIFGPEQVTDLNTIPTSLIERTEIVTGGSSAVYGSDAITGVVNFVMKDDYEGIGANAQYGSDSATSTPTFSVDFTAGHNFNEGRGNAVVSLNYYKRDGFTRTDRGDWAALPYGEGCVTQQTWSDTMIGTPNGASAANCAASGGKMGFVFSGSGDIPNGRFTLTNTQIADSQAQLAAAGLQGLGGNGFTFNDSGAMDSQRLVNRPADDFNLTQFNYLQVPQERKMVNAFAHYEFAPAATGYVELHYSNNKVDQQLTQSNIGGQFLFNIDNPYVDQDMRDLLARLDATEPLTSPPISQGAITQTTIRGDGLAIVSAGRRLVELPFRHNVDDHDVYRGAIGVKGDLGDASEKFFRSLAYDIYYSYAKSEDESTQDGAVSRSRYAQALLRVNGADPVANIFGQNLSQAAIDAVLIHSTNITNAKQQVMAGSLTGEAFDTWAGAVNFSVGLEWRKAEAEYLPDDYLRSGDVVGFTPGNPTAGEVTSKEFFAEVRVPILADVPGFKNVTINGAYRSSDYDLENVGRVGTYLYGLDWRIHDAVKVRAQWQHAIRAPNIGDLYGGTALGFQTNLTDPCSDKTPVGGRTAQLSALCQATGVPASAVFTQQVQPDTVTPFLTGGNPDLQEETSDTRTIGVVFTPFRDLFVSLDFFDITLDNAISQLGGSAQNVLNLCYVTLKDINSSACQAVRRNTATGAIQSPYAIQVLQSNIGGLSTRGLDLQAHYGADLGFGVGGESRLAIQTAWTYTDEFTVTPMQELPQTKNRCVGSFGNNFCPGGEPIPEYKGNTRFTWTTGPVGVSLRHRYIDAVTTDRYLVPARSGTLVPLMYPNLATMSNPKLDAMNYIDLSFTYNIGDVVELTAGANNVTDEDPPVVAGFGGYGNTYPATYDFAGTTYFLNVNVKAF
jgi:iron complex outermembrane recepter protein